MNNLAPSFSIWSSSFLQVTRTCMKAWMSLNFGKFAIELRPLINARIEFLLNILKTNRPIKTKFCIHIIIDKIYVGNVNNCCVFCNLQESYGPWLTSEFGFCSITWERIDREIQTKFCIHINCDKINISIVNLCFSQICNRVTALDWCQNLFFLEN